MRVSLGEVAQHLQFNFNVADALFLVIGRKQGFADKADSAVLLAWTIVFIFDVCRLGMTVLLLRKGALGLVPLLRIEALTVLHVFLAKHLLCLF